MPDAQPQAAALHLSPEDVRDWWARVEMARRRRDEQAQGWRKLLDGYLPGAHLEDINSNIHFRNVHLKCAELWAQMPDLHLKPLEPLNSLIDPQTQKPIAPADIVSIKRAVLNKKLGPDDADADQTILEALFDVFAVAGLGATKICYESDQGEVEADVPTGKMLEQPGSVLGLSPMVPETEKQTVPGPVVFERIRWYRFSMLKLLRPHDWRSTQFDEAPWLGMEFVEPLNARTRRKYQLPDDFESNVTRDELVLGADRESTPSGNAKLVRGIEIWLRAAQYDDTVINSQRYRRLVLVEGMKDEAAVYEDSPYQTVGPDEKLSHDSMLGNPIHPFVLRVMSDSDSPPADAAFTDPLVRLENTWVTQTVKSRDANIPRFVHSDVITEAIDKLKNVDVGQGVGIPDEYMQRGVEKLIAPLPHLERAESDIQGQQHIRRLTDETLGLGANQAGGINSTVRSATEVATVQANVSVRLKGEQNQLMKRWLAGVRKFDALVMRYTTDQGYIEIVGQDGQKRLMPFTQAMISGRYAYDAKPDSQLTMDPERRIKHFLDYTNFFAKSPWMDQGELARLGANEFGYDPARLVKPPQPPAPDKPNVSVRISGEDFANPIALAIFNKKDSAPLTIQEIQEAQALINATSQMVMANPAPMQVEAMAKEAAKNQPHGGAAETADVLSAHHGDLTGKMDGQAPQSVPQSGALH